MVKVERVGRWDTGPSLEDGSGGKEGMEDKGIAGLGAGVEGAVLRSCLEGTLAFQNPG